MNHGADQGGEHLSARRTLRVIRALSSPLVLVRALIYMTNTPLVLSVGIVPTCCGIIGCLLKDYWQWRRAIRAFRVRVLKAAGFTAAFCLILTLALCPFSCVIARAQTQANPQESSSSAPASAIPDGPKPNPRPSYVPGPDESYLYHAGAFCGVGASTSPVGAVPTTGCGAGFTFLPLPVFFEVGVMGPQANRSHFTGYISLDGSIRLASAHSKYLPMAIVGYSRLFETGHALDYGVALALPRFGKQKNDGSSLRIELRDYWTFASPNQHNIMLRVGWMGVESD